MRLDIGCGAAKKQGFHGVDLAPFPCVDTVCDVTKGLPFASGTVDEIYASHFMEHLGDQEVLPFLRECHRVLKPGGAMEILVPDLEYAARLFLETPEPDRWNWPFALIFGSQWHPGEFHKTGYSRWKIQWVLQAAGFEVASCESVSHNNSICIRVKAVKKED